MTAWANKCAYLMCGVAGMALMAAPANAQAPQPYNISPSPLAAALDAFASQSHEQILATGDLINGKTSPGATAVTDPQVALEHLLQGTGLTYRRSGHTFLIVKAPSATGLQITRIADQTAGPVASASLAAAPTTLQSTGLEEVVVTATRQIDTVNRVALSIAAVTQQTLDEQGLKNAQDLVRVVPGLNVTGAVNGVAIFSIRGIVATVGAATTGIYLDDTSLSKRANTGISQNNGAPAPLLFDLERVEVLKGPQGTLYGGSSEGGTIRYITPTPSLTKYSGFARVEVNQVNHGDIGNEVGVAVGGPIVQDKLGFRFSAMERKTAGWIDVYSPYDNSKLATDVNGHTDYAFRAAGLWQVTDRLSAELSAYTTFGQSKGEPRYNSSTVLYGPDGQRAPASQTFSTPQTCFDTSRLAVTSRPPVAVVTCPAAGQPVPANIFVRRQYDYGPFRQLTKDEAFAVVGQTRVESKPTKNSLEVGALTLNYNFDNFSMKSITSVLGDGQGYYSSGSEDPNNSQSTIQDPTHQAFPLFAYPGPTGVIGDYTGGFTGRNDRDGVQQEIRFSSKADARPFSWVAGAFYNDATTHIRYYYPGNDDAPYLQFWGVTAAVRYGVDRTRNSQAFLDATIHDREVAGFADVNYWLTEKLKLTAGFRVSQVELNYHQLAYGQFDQRGPDVPQSITDGVAKATPVTPKFGAEYQFTPNDLVYVTASKGFRAGGVNPQVSEAFCSVGLAQAGIRSDQVPASYGPDTVWSYELGGKFRLLDNTMQINAAAYRIDWTQVQATIPLSCGFNFVMNGGAARSEGFDLQTQWRPIPALTLGANASYTNARYIDGVAGPNPQPGIKPSINPGDGFNIPPWQVSASAEYTHALTAKVNGYLRGDYQLLSSYLNGTSFGTSSYNFFTRNVPAVSYVNARLGARFEAFDINVYANNLLDYRQQLGNAGVGRVGCKDEQCAGYTTFTPFVSQGYQAPRTVGLQVNYRF
jgi:iron complex outermembrane receptor protein